MHIRIKTYMTLGLILMLYGCTNTMYFYETEKISLTVEARPDSSQPVQGSLGFKQRVALIVPKKSNKQSVDESNKQLVDNSNKQAADGEALSAMSSFNFKIKEEPGFNPILIQTAFVTGAAAEEFSRDEKKAGVVAEAIALKGSEIEDMGAHADCVINKAANAEPSKFDLLKEIVKKDNSRNFSDKDWNNLIDIGRPCGISDRMLYADSVHQALQKKLNK